VADFLQTDDLYQLGKPLELPGLPDLDQLHAWPCPHPRDETAPAGLQPAPGPIQPTAATNPFAPTFPAMPGQRTDKPAEPAASPLADVSDPAQSARDPNRRQPVPEPPSGDPTSRKDQREPFSRFLGVLRRPSGASTSAAVPTGVQPPGPLAPDLSLYSSVAGLRRSS
jgi:hypothetical protein